MKHLIKTFTFCLHSFQLRKYLNLKDESALLKQNEDQNNSRGKNNSISSPKYNRQ